MSELHPRANRSPTSLASLFRAPIPISSIRLGTTCRANLTAMSHMGLAQQLNLSNQLSAQGVDYMLGGE